MTGRALEAVARHFHASSEADRLMLGRGLDQLHKSGVIDNRLHEWGKELQQNRNLAAHATSTMFDRRDAEDLFDFAIAICESCSCSRRNSKSSRSGGRTKPDLASGRPG
jgi:hypothetical protein